MKTKVPRISVLMITYNQEKLVGRAIESLLRQKDYIYEICINDDCSKDGTWDVLKEYESKYPQLVKPIRNEKNLGIFQNIEATWERPSGDMIYCLSGDDESGDGFFKAVLEFIETNNIDWENELFCIYGDYIQRFPNGTDLLYKQEAAIKNVQSIRLKLRGMLSNRATCYNIKVLKKFENVSEGRDYSVEAVQDCQLAMFTEKNYYIPVVGNVYYAAIGVSVQAKEGMAGRGDVMREKLLNFMAAKNIRVNKKDLAFMTFRRSFKQFQQTKSISTLFKAILCYLKSIDLRLGWDTFYLKELLQIRRRKAFYK